MQEVPWSPLLEVWTSLLNRRLVFGWMHAPDVSVLPG